MDKNKKAIKISIIILVITIVISAIMLSIFRYAVEGEKNMPFKITSIRIVSTAVGTDVEDAENKWHINVSQTNDFYFYIEKNSDYSKDDSISKIVFNNFKVQKSSDLGTVGIYRPSTNYILFDYSDEFKIENELCYTGTLNNNLASLEISNQGGLVSFSIALQDLGTYISNENENIIEDGSLLSKINLTNDDIKTNISFDIIIETTSKNKYKSTISFDLPTGNIIEEGRCILNKENLNDIIFKRF